MQTNNHKIVDYEKFARLNNFSYLCVMIHKETIMQTNNHKIVDYDTVLDKNGKPVITPPSEIIEKKPSKH